MTFLLHRLAHVNRRRGTVVFCLPGGYSGLIAATVKSYGVGELGGFRVCAPPLARGSRPLLLGAGWTGLVTRLSWMTRSCDRVWFPGPGLGSSSLPRLRLPCPSSPPRSLTGGGQRLWVSPW